MKTRKTNIDAFENTPMGATGEGEVVLVIDDDPTIRTLVAEALNDTGYSVIEAADGPAGLRISTPTRGSTC